MRQVLPQPWCVAGPKTLDEHVPHTAVRLAAELFHAQHRRGEVYLDLVKQIRHGCHPLVWVRSLATANRYTPFPPASTRSSTSFFSVPDSQPRLYPIRARTSSKSAGRITSRPSL